jgi:transcriptional regulator with XRE-family HTH domain
MGDKHTWADVKRSFDFEPQRTAASEQADIAADVGAVIRAARLEAKITQSALAEAMGTSQPAVARLEGGANVPSVDTLVKVSSALGQYLVVGILTVGEAKEAGFFDRPSGRATLIPRVASPETLAAEAPVEEGVGSVERFFGARQAAQR